MEHQKNTFIELLKKSPIAGVSVDKARKYGVKQPSKRIYDLRIDGYKIVTTTVRKPCGDIQTFYRLVKR